MSVIAAFTDGRFTWIASDTCSVTSSLRFFDSGPKWVIEHGWAYGCVGDSRALFLARRCSDELFKGLEDPGDFAERLRDVYRRHDIRPVYPDGEAVPHYGSSGILARAGEVWDIDGALSVMPVKRGTVFARGTAALAAECAAWGYQKAMRTSPPLLLKIAIEGAIAHDHTIRGVWQETMAPLKTEQA